MEKIKNIISYLEEKAPLRLQESYDNSGLILGSRESTVSKVLICLDADESALDAACKNGCQLIISHHPAIFKAIKVFTDNTREGKFLFKAIKNNVSLYSIHTNFDSADGGLTDLLCKKLGLENINVLRNTSGEENHGLGRYGTISPMKGIEFVEYLKKSLSLSVVRLIGEIPERITKVAVFNGSYDRDILEELCSLAPDVLITGDVKYHDAQELIYNGIFTVDAGHYGTEKHFVEFMAEILSEKFPELDIVHHEGSDVFRYHFG